MTIRTEILFDDLTRDISSRPFYLYPKTLAIFRAYNFQTGKVFDVLSPGVPAEPGQSQRCYEDATLAVEVPCPSPTDVCYDEGEDPECYMTFPSHSMDAYPFPCPPCVAAGNCSGESLGDQEDPFWVRGDLWDASQGHEPSAEEVPLASQHPRHVFTRPGRPGTGMEIPCPGFTGVFKPGDPGRPAVPPTTSFKYDPAACLYMLHLEEYLKPPPSFEQEQGGWYPLPESTRIRAEVQVCNDGCFWSLSAKNNINFLDVPGYYRLLLNHVDLVGNVFVTAHIYTEQDYPGSKAVGLYYGGER